MGEEADTPNGELRRAIERISLGICKANGVYMDVMRTGRLRSGLNKAEAAVKSAERKRREREEADRVRAEREGAAMAQVVELTTDARVALGSDRVQAQAQDVVPTGEHDAMEAATGLGILVFGFFKVKIKLN